MKGVKELSRLVESTTRLRLIDKEKATERKEKSAEKSPTKE